VKIYRKCEKFPLGGRLTQWLEEREVGEEITIRHPFGRFNYLGEGRIQIRNFG
jgi:nitrate reductase (NAD(P)H)